MGIAFGSINTGLPKDIVQQLIAAEKIPIEKMEARKGKIIAKKKLVTELHGLVEGIRGHLATNGNARGLREIRIDSNFDVIGVNADKNVALPGSYQFEVTQLAKKSSALSSGFADKDDSYVGVGFIQYSLPNGDEKDIYIDADNASLSGVAKVINKDTKNGMRATVINDGTDSDTPWRLLISLDNTGAGNKADFPYFYFVDGEDDLYISEEREAQNAKVKLDGFEVEISENKANELIPGLSIDLKKAKPGDEFTIQVSEDVEAVAGKVGELVTKINGVLDFIKIQNKLDEKTDTSQTLGGDIILQTIESRVRGTVFKNIKTEFGAKRFGDLGVSFQRDGTLKLDQKKFEAILAENYDMVSQVLTGSFTLEGGKNPGFMDHLNDTCNALLRFPDGVLSSRKKSMQSKIDMTDRRIHNKQRIIEQKEKNLKAKFSRLEGTIAKIKSQGAGLGNIAPAPQLG